MKKYFLNDSFFIELFWSRVDKSPGHGPQGDCWEWIGCIQLGKSAGYGIQMCDGKSQRAHRIAWQMERGPIPEGIHVLHHCDNRKCVNPEHLFLGTNYDNVQDKLRKGRHLRGEDAAKYSNPKRGSDNWHSRFTDAQVIEMRQWAAEGMNYGEIARRVGTRCHVVNMIVHGRRWAHIPGALPLKKRSARVFADEIRRMKAEGFTQRFIAAKLNFSEPAISRVARSL
jgi:hypothetical protein